MADLTESITVEAAATALYALVSDLPRMREWSPTTLARLKSAAEDKHAPSGRGET
jgi:hypothetical protein